MKKSFRMILSLVLMLMLVMSLATTAYAADSTVTYKGQNDKFDFGSGSSYTATDLFANFKNVMPGDTLKQTITFKNDAKDCDYVRLYLKAVPHGTGNDMSANVAAKEPDVAKMNEFLSQLTMKVTCDGKEIFNASPNQAGGLATEQFLGEVSRGKTVKLNVELTVPITMGNDFANRVGEVDWVFLVEAFNNTQLTVRKVWSDGAAKHKDDSVLVYLLQNNDKVQEVTLNAANNWTHTFEHLSTDDEWTVKEVNIPQGYTVQYNTKGNETTILNIKDGTPTYEPLDITVKKVWSGDQGKNRPTSVNVTLYNGTEIWERVKLSAANDWTFTWYDPDTYGNWQVLETSIPKGYVPSYKVKDGVVTITNSRSLIQTGQLNWPIWVLGGFGIAFIILGETMLMKKKKGNNA